MGGRSLVVTDGLGQHDTCATCTIPIGRVTDTNIACYNRGQHKKKKLQGIENVRTFVDFTYVW